MKVPGIVWEAGIADDLREGGKLEFIALGIEGSDSDEVIGWLAVIRLPSGLKKLLVTQRYEPRLLKTFTGIRGLARQYCPEWDSVTVPIVPSMHSLEQVWAWIGAPDS